MQTNCLPLKALEDLMHHSFKMFSAGISQWNTQQEAGQFYNIECPEILLLYKLILNPGNA